MLTSSYGAWAAEPQMPFESKWQHVGVATCAGSNCHGSQRPFDDSPVLQNEYFLWQREDAHSNAYKLLLSPEGQRIARNLGIKDATSAPECLTCHTDFVPQDRQGRRFAFSEGVGCEACHGGAKDWLGPHVSGNTHAENIAAGLYPLEDPVARGRLCLSCHLGTDKKPIDHRIMGAGHPPLEFELDTFTNIQPAHFRVDADYRKRKNYVPGAKTWAIGQLLAADTVVEGLLSPRFTNGGMFPELVFFDCNACHHPMRPPRWQPGAGGPLGPGEVRLADAYMVMSGAVLQTVAPDLATQWTSSLKQLHEASGKSVSEVRTVAAGLSKTLDAALQRTGDHRFSKAEALSLMDRLAEIGLNGKLADFTSAKQIFYGSDALLAYLKQEHRFESKAISGAVDGMFAAVDVKSGYDPDIMRKALQSLRSAIAKLPAA